MTLGRTEMTDYVDTMSDLPMAEQDRRFREEFLPIFAREVKAMREERARLDDPAAKIEPGTDTQFHLGNVEWWYGLAFTYSPEIQAKYAGELARILAQK